MTNQLVILRGLQGSGKSTVAMEMVKGDPVGNTVRIERDEIRGMLFGKYVLDHKQEETVTKVQHTAIKEALKSGKTVVVSDTNLRAATHKALAKIGHAAGVKVRTQDVVASLEDCISRCAKRASSGGREVPETVIRSTYQRYFRKGEFPPVPEVGQEDKVKIRKVEPNPALPPAILVDVDGTLAFKSSDRGYFDWTRVGEDEVIEPVRLVVEAVRQSNIALDPNFKVFIFSGRDSVCYLETAKWLKDNEITYDELVMRPKGSMAPDTEVKAEMFDSHVRDKYNVVAVFDDRLSVARMWHEMGLPLFRVGDPESDF